MNRYINCYASTHPQDFVVFSRNSQSVSRRTILFTFSSGVEAKVFLSALMTFRDASLSSIVSIRRTFSWSSPLKLLVFKTFQETVLSLTEWETKLSLEHPWYILSVGYSCQIRRHLIVSCPGKNSFRHHVCAHAKFYRSLRKKLHHNRFCSEGSKRPYKIVSTIHTRERTSCLTTFKDWTFVPPSGTQWRCMYSIIIHTIDILLRLSPRRIVDEFENTETTLTKVLVS